ncbi:MAG: hypothetical protein SFY32_09215 [Bacteroidota bacterium]|nr:hypothetical protein [Bacteroidota bacterium]
MNAIAIQYHLFESIDFQAISQILSHPQKQIFNWDLNDKKKMKAMRDIKAAIIKFQRKQQIDF